MSALIESGGLAGERKLSESSREPLPLDFLEFLTQRLGVERHQAAALLGSHVKDAWAQKSSSAP